MPVNSTFLPLRPPAPLPGAGWQVTVYAHTDMYAYARATAGLGPAPTPLARIARYRQLSWSPEISEAGVGSITIALTDPIWSYALADGRPGNAIKDSLNLFVVTEDGQWRGEFLGEKVEPVILGPGEYGDAAVTISGGGAARVLARARVLSPYYPKPTPKGKIGVYQYKNLPIMASWLQLLAAAQRRGTATPVHCKFSGTKDSGGWPWEDAPLPKPKNWDRATLAGDILFPFGSYALTATGQAAVAKIAAKLAQVTNPVVSITGHTDSVGTLAYNQQLSIDRASAVANAILTIRPLAQVTTYGRGETQPVASNRTAAGRRKNRRVVVTYQRGPVQTDTVYTPERGTDLLTLLKGMTSGQTTAVAAVLRGPIHCEWLMTKGFQLIVRSQIGVDRSSTAVFHEGSSYLVRKGGTYDRTNLGNVVAVQNNQLEYRVAADPKSVARWGQYEAYTGLEESYAPAVHAQIAASTLAASADQETVISIGIAPGEGRTPFRDFGLGDWIGLVTRNGRYPSTVDKQRVMALTVTVDGDGNAAYEVTLQGTRASRVKWLQTQIDALTTQRHGIRAFIQDDEPTGGLPGDLWTPLASTLTG